VASRVGTSAGTVWAIVVAAGSGTRFGAAKQYALLGGQTVLALSVGAARSACDGVIAVVPPRDERRSEVLAVGADAVARGGDSRSASVRSGLALVPAEATIVVVHDAARPLATPELFSRVVGALDAPDVDGAVCGVEVTDTIKQVDAGRVTATLDRRRLAVVQTPQAFKADVLRHAVAAAAGVAGAAETADGEAQGATDDAALVEAIGGRLVVVPGDPSNIKLTYPDDLRLAEALLGR